KWGRLAAPRRDCPLPKRKALVGNDQVRIEVAVRAEASAGRTRAVRAVEGEESRRELGIGDPAIRTRIALTEYCLGRPIAVMDKDPADLLAVAESDLERIGEAALHATFQHEAIDDDLDRMGLILRERQLFFQVVDLA